MSFAIYFFFDWRARDMIYLLQPLRCKCELHLQATSPIPAEEALPTESWLYKHFKAGGSAKA